MKLESQRVRNLSLRQNARLSKHTGPHQGEVYEIIQYMELSCDDAFIFLVFVGRLGARIAVALGGGTFSMRAEFSR
jgi:hypothetical protein